MPVRYFVFFCVFIFLPKLSGKEKPFAWSADRKLTWSDFQGRVPASVKIDQLHTKEAETSSGILMKMKTGGKNPVYKVDVVAVFDPSKSWVHSKDSSGLIHEQGHFDITEINARDLRKELSQTTFKRNNFTVRLRTLYNRTNVLAERMQEEYDKETIHHLDTLQQNRWNKLIADSLQALSSWSDTTVTLSVKD